MNVLHWYLPTWEESRDQVLSSECLAGLSEEEVRELYSFSEVVQVINGKVGTDEVTFGEPCQQSPGPVSGLVDMPVLVSLGDGHSVSVSGTWVLKACEEVGRAALAIVMRPFRIPGMFRRQAPR